MSRPGCGGWFQPDRLKSTKTGGIKGSQDGIRKEFSRAEAVQRASTDQGTSAAQRKLSAGPQYVISSHPR